ncbi:hypothetical protein ACQ33O_03430 [Ferruginibacter sp. SUN002]|uniref:hypothetical protein n=1 Tax=Ferruginibacter sp. SUN002 TaxID=2937789 RepID=UPI003D359FE9
MKQKFLFSSIFLLFTVFFADAQKVIRKGTEPLTRGDKPGSKGEAAYTLDQFQGKWQEVSRTTKKGKSAVIKDTIYLHFTDGNKVDTREGNKPNVKGEADIDVDNTLLAAADFYIIKSVSEKEIVLDDDDKFVHTFQKVDHFWFEQVGNLTVAIDTFKTVTEYDPANLIGDWGVYRRQAKPGEVKPPTKLIKYLKIKTKVDETTLKGEITVYEKEKTEELPCTITVYKTGMQVEAGTYKWYLPIYKADGKELVFGNVELMLNYCKPL